MKTMMNETPKEISTTNSRGNNKMKKFTKLFKNEKGLTLIELLAVIVILAIVAAIAVPAIGNVIDNSRVKAVKADAVNIMNAANLYFSTDTSPTATFTDTDTKGYLESKGSFTSFTVTNASPDTFQGVAKIGGKTYTFADTTTLDKFDPGSAEITGEPITVTTP